jgi:rubrerythrin
MLSQTPIDLSKLSKGNIDKEVLRLAVIAELDAISLYEQLAAMTDNKYIKAVLLDVAGEEKTHVGEFHAMLLDADKQQEDELAAGKKEVEEIKEE